MIDKSNNTKKDLIILFDGECNLCNTSVQFIIEHDKRATFRFSSLQSNYGQQFLKKYRLSSSSFNSMILIDGNKHYFKSSAILRIAKELNGCWPVFYFFIVIPAFVRDFFYTLIARNRYRLFGKIESCWLPTIELKARFID